ncbi:MAG: bifunctional (p)ppGpp synthetase/guanosine-3',5'-bis(diphosphate) 3'-pyrophosphohydrolase [Steroidobacteraceae bacterium]
METEDPINPDVAAALVRGEAALQQFAVGSERRQAARSAARIVGALTQDASVASGVLLHEALDPASLDASAVAQEFGASAVAIARELRRLGEFGGGAQWSTTQPLPPGQAETLRKMLLAIVSDPRLVVARLGIQLSRLRAARQLAPAAREALAVETRAVFAPLANRLGVWHVKWQLEDLAFRYLEPDVYAGLAAQIDEPRLGRERYIREFCDTLRAALAEAGVTAEVHGRPKHLWSIWRKMQRKGLALDELYDLRAVRIICRSIPDCYAALGVVHGRWSYLPGQFDDYIATPKGNDYRSIHTAVFGPEQRVVEVQIRTEEMHQQSELGVAAHWRYKEGSARDAHYERKIEWVRRLLDPAETGQADPDFIESARSELFADRIYALTPRGEVVDLPRDATALDFAYHVHTSLGHRCRGAKANGRIIPLTEPLHNGEVVEIITGKQEQPSRDWLAPDQGYLVSARSRAKVRAWFRRLDAGDNEIAGRSIAERELARVGASGDLLPALVADLKAGDTQALYRRLGEGDISSTEFAQAILRRQQRGARHPGGHGGSPRPAGAVQASPRASRCTPAPRRASNPIEVEGVGDLPLTLARCCRPVRPEAIVGYVTLGRGVTVHAATCASLRRMQVQRPERVLAVRWRSDSGQTLPVEITVLAYDRRGLVRDLSDVVATAEIGIESLTTSTDRASGTARTVIRTAVSDLAQLARLERALKAVANVLWVRRTA